VRAEAAFFKAASALIFTAGGGCLAGKAALFVKSRGLQASRATASRSTNAAR